MSLTLPQQPASFTEVSNSDFSAGAAVTAADIANVANAATLGAFRCEQFWGYYANGETVQLPVSPADGYAYSRSECLYSWHVYWTGGATGPCLGTQTAPPRGATSGQGQMLQYNANVNQSSGVVTSVVVYQKSGTQITNDGILLVITLARREASSLTLSGVPAFADIQDDVFSSGQQLTVATLSAINSNAKYGLVRYETFWGFYRNGEIVSLPTSPADGYTYSRNELLYQFSVFWSGSAQPCNGTQTTPTLRPASGAGQILQMGFDVSQATGLATCNVSYYSSSETDTNDGILMVITHAQRSRSSEAVLDVQPGFGYAAALFASGDPVTEAALIALNENANFAVARNEQFYGFYANGDTVVLPVSPADGYQYSQEECYFTWAIYWTGSATGPCQGAETPPPRGSTSGQGTALQMGFNVSQVTGVVTCNVSYYKTSEADTGDGILLVITHAQRGR